jgi:hypothetical protein
MKAITYNGLHLMSFYVFLMPLFFCACTADVQREEKQKCQLNIKPVVIEAEGFASSKEGLTRSTLHRFALRDARRNALVQAHVILDTDTCIKGFQLEDDTQHFQSAGYVEWMQVLEAGFVPRASPAVYRVRVKACVYPMHRLEGETAFGRVGVQSVPSVVIRFSSNLSEDRYPAIQSSLEESLRRCGLNIIPSGEAEFAAVLEVNISGQPPEDPQSIVLWWEVGDKRHGSERELDEPAAFACGRIHCADYPSQGDKLWQKAGLEIAQDVFQTWITPRPTHFVFRSIHPEHLDAIAAAFGRDAEIRKEKDEDALELDVIVPAAGNSLYLANSVLRATELNPHFEVAQLSFTQLVFVDKDSK